MKIILIIVVNFLFFCDALLAQDKMLIAEGATPNLYVTHTVAPKENFYSIGRLYNVSPKEIAPYNNLVLENGLSLGQTIKIPLNQNNFFQESTADQNTMVPLYHVIEPKEGLYHVSTTYNKVSTDILKKWNNLQTDVVSNGTTLIVGYLNVQNIQPSSPQTTLKSKAVEVAKPTKKADTSGANTDLPDLKKADTKKPSTEDNNANEATTIIGQPVKQESKPANNEVVFNKSAVNFKGGAFKKLFDDQIDKKIEMKESGISGVFKSTSGWQDGKYYCFHNIAAPGTIIKITSMLTGKSVYAKVLDLIPDIQQNEGLLLHISNSAAEELGVAADNRFNCSLSYSK